MFLSILCLLPLLLSPVASLPSKRDNTNITGTYTVNGQISIYKTNGDKVGCLNTNGAAIADPPVSSGASSSCAVFTSVKTDGYEQLYPTWAIPTSNFSVASPSGFCGVVLHSGDAYAKDLNQDYGHVWQCCSNMPLSAGASTGYAHVQYQNGVNALVDKQLLVSGFSGYNEYWNTVGGVQLNDTPAVMQAKLPDYSLGDDLAFVAEYYPNGATS